MRVWLQSFLSGSCVKAGQVNQPEASNQEGTQLRLADLTCSTAFQVKIS